MRRASRKNSAVEIFVAILIAVVSLILGSYINYLISIRGEKYKKTVHSVIAHFNIR
jgi:hypothetical protein